ncbi:MAG: CotH kinase family protein [Lachnospiraceae bacterium]|nr:CotH kinase family protein [Lachnospiraceae bacterium]
MRKAKKLLSGLLCSAVIITGFAGYTDYGTVSVKAEDNTAANSTKEANRYVVGEDTLPYTDDELYNQLFDIHNKVTIDLDMPNEEMAKLEADYEKNSSSPIYRMGDVTFTIELENGSVNSYLIKEVGIRMKGNMTRNKFFNPSSNEVYDLIHFKLSFKQTFDDEADGYLKGEYYINEDGTSKWKETEEGKAARKVRKDRKFAGVEKLDLKWNGNYDNTYIREYYAYKIFNSEGVWAPQMNLASMNFGDVSADNVYHMGVYSIHECVDELFINRHLKDNTNDQGGDLYKAAWTMNGADFTKNTSMGISDDFTGTKYNYDLKTNKKTSDYSLLQNVINTLNSENLTKEKYESVVDVDNFIKFAAVAYFVGNPDDIRNNFNNYYAYIYPSTSAKAGKVVLIPYDYDRCLGVTCGWNPDGTGMTDVSPFSNMAEGLRRSQVNPLYTYGIDKGGYYVEEYKEALAKVASNELFTIEAFEKDFNTANKLYAEDAQISDNLKIVDFNSTAGGGKWSSEERKAKFRFTLDDDAETEDYSSSRSNITYSNYVTSIKANYKIYLENMVTEPGYYIEFVGNKWSPNKDYKMSYDKSTDTYSYTWTVTEQTVFIVADVDSNFYRYSSISGSIPSGVSENLAGNIVLEPGTYVIKFNAKSKKITVSSGSDQSIDIKLKLDANGGKIGSAKTKTKTVTYGKKIGSLSTPKRAGYTFKGWYTKKSGGSKITSSTKCNFKKNTTIYAQWVKVKVGAAAIKKAVSTASKTITLTISKVSGASGYEVVYSTDSKYKSAKKKTIKSTSVKLTGLSKGKTYYIKVRAYKNDSTGAKVYGKYASGKVKVK